MSVLKETWDRPHSVPVAPPPSTSHPAGYPQPPQPRGWALLPFPQFLIPREHSHFGCEPSWLLACPLLIFLGPLAPSLISCSPPPPLLSHGSVCWPCSVWILPDTCGGTLPHIYSEPSPQPYRSSHILIFSFKKECGFKAMSQQNNKKAKQDKNNCLG